MSSGERPQPELEPTVMDRFKQFGSAVCFRLVGFDRQGIRRVLEHASQNAHDAPAEQPNDTPDN